ncbi:MAG: hypothetical protein DIU63_06165 [Proteobacteria bacterium]|jgi:hypothetical protein|nr:MAG: hypothetical protein DIU63_06165 [Pseudomonadota bacterium]
MATPLRKIIPFVIAALVSGILSYATEGMPRLSHELQAQLTSYFINPQLLLPGVWYGLVLAGLAWILGARGILGAIAALVMTWVGWQLAVQAGIVAFDRFAAVTPDETTRLTVAGAAGGLVGAFISFVGVRLGVPMKGTFLALIATLIVGAVFGLLLPWSSTRQSAGLLLYAAWQPAVTATMAWFAVVRRKLV